MKVFDEKEKEIVEEHCRTNISLAEVGHVFSVMIGMLAFIVLIAYGGFYFFIG